ncbi:MAG: peptide-binding protein [Candidatus Omnitrophica bacterium]|nr:peptide-binding protein [Candidatus Omnitrophota bacterium]
MTAFLLAGLSPSLASLLPPSQEPAPSYGDALISASLGEPSTLVPILASDSASAEVCSLLFNGLVKYDVDLRVTGDLAERWEILDGGLTIEFTLKKGIRWHDGHPLTTRDVAFTYEKLMDPAVPTPYRGDFERIAGLTVIDDRTIRVRYKEPFAPALSSWGMSILPEHLLKGQDLLTTAFKENPVGTGPFKFRRWIRGDRVELSANDDYFEGRPYLDHCFFRVIPDASTIFLELQAQGVDWASLTPLQFARMSQAPAFERSFRKFRFPSFGYTYLGYNLQDPKFQDRRVRQAINLAIDKSEIIQGVLLGLGREATGPFPPESWACNPEVQPAPFDPSYARALLAEAGWSDKDGDGVLDRAGQPFEFTLLTNQGNLTRELTAQIIQRRLKEIGVRVKIRILEWSSLLKEFIDKRRFEAILLGWALSREPDPFDIWHSSKTKPGEFNFIGYRDPRVDELLIKGRTTYDEASRRKAYHELHRILYEDQPVCFLFVPDALPAVHRRFEGVEVSPLGVGHNLIHWYAPRARQRFRLEP